MVCENPKMERKEHMYVCVYPSIYEYFARIENRNLPDLKKRKFSRAVCWH